MKRIIREINKLGFFKEGCEIIIENIMPNLDEFDRPAGKLFRKVAVRPGGKLLIINLKLMCQEIEISNCNGLYLMGQEVYIPWVSVNKELKEIYRGYRLSQFLFNIHILFTELFNYKKITLDNYTDDPLRASTKPYGIYNLFQRVSEDWVMEYHVKGDNISFIELMNNMKEIIGRINLNVPADNLIWNSDLVNKLEYLFNYMRQSYSGRTKRKRKKKITKKRKKKRRKKRTNKSTKKRTNKSKKKRGKKRTNKQ